MKIFSGQQIREADAYTIKHEPISSWQLMEKAARTCYSWFNTHVSRKKSIAIFCGKGNNGGDGLALARMLHATNYKVAVVIVEHSSNASADFTENLKRLETTKVPIAFWQKGKSAPNINADLWVDALLGSGLNKPLHGFLKNVVAHLNVQPGFKLAIDLPTGLFADSNAENSLKSVFKANQTLTFQCPKQSFLFSEFGSFVGQFTVLDIGLSPAYLEKTETDFYYITQEMVIDFIPVRSKFQHKGDFGHGFILAGSIGKCGAAILASKAALKSGAGLVTVGVPEVGTLPLQAANPEVMVWPQSGVHEISSIQIPNKISAIGVGPGLGTSQNTGLALLDFLPKINQPTVFDADALNLISSANAWDKLPKNSILTPHLGELDRMLNKICRGEEIVENARNFAEKHEQILIVKGAHTGIYLPDGRVFFNSSGTNAMATAGSGDVLTGILTGLLAQGLSPEHAAIVGVFYHGKAGEEAAQKIGERAVTASDIIQHISIE